MYTIRSIESEPNSWYGTSNVLLPAMLKVPNDTGKMPPPCRLSLQITLGDEKDVLRNSPTPVA